MKKPQVSPAANVAPGKEVAPPFFQLVPLPRLVPNNYNARRFEQGDSPQRRARFEELVASVMEKGILEPLLVRAIGDDRFEVVAGERRFRAAQKVTLRMELDEILYLVPCMVHDLDDDAAFDIMVVENLQREDLTPFESAQAFKAYLERHGNRAEAVQELAARTGIPGHAIRRQVRLLALPADILAAWKDGQISQSHAELFTRLDDAPQALELLGACLRGKLTVRELAERIGAVAPDLDKGFFDKGECHGCQFNTSVQSGLFADVAPAGKCGSPACFEAKQGEFLAERWPESKPAKSYGTTGFRFGHRLADEPREPIVRPETAGRCLTCDAFVSVLRLTGLVVSGYERTCVGPRACFEELYCGAVPVATATPVEEPPVSEIEEPAENDDALMNDVDGCGRGREKCPEDGSTCADCLDPPDSTAAASLADKLAEARGKRKATEPATAPTAGEEGGPVFDAARGERARTLFFREALKIGVNNRVAKDAACQRLVLAVMALSSPSVKRHLAAGLGWEKNITPKEMAKSLFEVPPEEIGDQVVAAALAHVIDDGFAFAASGVLPLIAERFGIELGDWQMSEQYLGALSKSELVRIGEEPGVMLWEDADVEAYRKANFKGKALRALGKTELIACILKSGADLYGKIPAEVLGRTAKR